MFSNVFLFSHRCFLQLWFIGYPQKKLSWLNYGLNIQLYAGDSQCDEFYEGTPRGFRRRCSPLAPFFLLLETGKYQLNLFRKVVEGRPNLVPCTELHGLEASHDVGQRGRHEQILLLQTQLFPAEKLQHFDSRSLVQIILDKTTFQLQTVRLLKPNNFKGRQETQLPLTDRA